MSQSVLVIEDEFDTGHLITWTLSAVGMRAVLVHSRDDALFRLRTDSYDTILMDYQMPGLRAEEFLDLVRSKYPATKVVLITAAWRAESLSQELMTDGYISKPFDPKKLSTEIAAL